MLPSEKITTKTRRHITFNRGRTHEKTDPDRTYNRQRQRYRLRRFHQELRNRMPLTENFNLDEARANEVERILNSYKQVKEKARNGQYREIPTFVETRQAQIAISRICFSTASLGNR